MKKVMTINYKLWERILSAINEEADLSKDNVIEKIKRKLPQDSDEYKEWSKTDFNVNYHLFHIVYKHDNRLLRKENKFTLLHAAVHGNLKNITKALLRVEGINVDVGDRRGYTSLQWAICYNHQDIAHTLMKNGARSLLNENCNTPGDLSKDNSIKNLSKEVEETQLRALKKSIFYGGTIALLGTAAAVALFANGVIASAIMMVVATIVAIAVTHMMLKPNTEVKVNEREMHTPQYLTYSDPNPIGM